ncbi:MAG: Gfo/Idh/MocA family protein [Phycisphaerae bacterium]
MADKSVSSESLAIETTTEFTGKKFRVAFIGCGGITRTHMKAFEAFPDVEVVAACDIDPARLDVFGNKYGVTKLYKDWRQMLAEVKPEGVNVCTPNGVHAAPAIDSLDAGAHVMVEKPMAMTPAEAQAMCDAAKRNKRQLTVGFQYRLHPNSAFLKRAADEGQFGNVMFVRCQALRRRGIPNWGVFGQKHLQGGGPMIDVGVHVIEMAHYVMGRPRPVAATGNTWTFHGNKPSDVVSNWSGWDHETYTVEDMAVGHIRFENGAVLHIEASFVAHIEKDVWNFQLMGDKGGCTWEPPVIYRDVAGTMINAEPGWLPKDGSFDDLHRKKLRAWVDAATNGAPQMAPGEDGLAVQKMLDGVYRSAEGGGAEVVIE